MDITAIDIGLVLIRVGLAYILFAHSTQKLLGWFSGSGPDASAALFEKLGQRPGKTMVYLAATCEMIAAASLLFGFLVPVGAAVGLGTMTVAGACLTRLNGTFWNAAGGGEYPHLIALVLAAVAFTGPGAVSIDARLDLPWSERPALAGAAALIVGVLAALPPILKSRQAADQSS